MPRDVVCIGIVSLTLFAAAGCARDRRVAGDPFLRSSSPAKATGREVSPGAGSAESPPPRRHTTINIAEAADRRETESPDAFRTTAASTAGTPQPTIPDERTGKPLRANRTRPTGAVAASPFAPGGSDDPFLDPLASPGAGTAPPFPGVAPAAAHTAQKPANEAWYDAPPRAPGRSAGVRTASVSEDDPSPFAAPIERQRNPLELMPPEDDPPGSVRLSSSSEEDVPPAPRAARPGAWGASQPGRKTGTEAKPPLPLAPTGWHATSQP